MLDIGDSLSGLKPQRLKVSCGRTKVRPLQSHPEGSSLNFQRLKAAEAEELYGRA